jgi:lipid A 4'-phosphatase
MPDACMPPADPLGTALRLWGLALLAFGVFALWPGIDLAVSGLFFVPGQGFPVADMIWIDRGRRAIWGASILLVAVAVAALAVAALRRAPVLRLDARDWAFILALYALGPGLLVETLLKGHWGRARPADVLPFGGTRGFTAPHEITDQCLSNCSFTAGEMAGAVALAIALALVASRWRGRTGARAGRLARAAILTIPLVAGLQRIAAGRHFLSDVVLSALAVGLVAVALAAVLRLRPPA